MAYLLSISTAVRLHRIQSDLGMARMFCPGLHKVKAVKAPCAVHSHNDEVRAVPLWDALEHGMLFIEPDVIHRDGQLFIAHNEDDIAAEDTLATLYLEPLYALLSALHPEPPSGAARPSIYPSAPDQPLYLVVDFKFGGKESVPSFKKIRLQVHQAEDALGLAQIP